MVFMVNEEKQTKKVSIKEKLETIIKQEIVIKNPCPKCGFEMIITGAGHSGKDFYCKKCGNKTTRMI